LFVISLVIAGSRERRAQRSELPQHLPLRLRGRALSLKRKRKGDEFRSYGWDEPVLLKPQYFLAKLYFGRIPGIFIRVVR